jgi:hypothetical protein
MSGRYDVVDLRHVVAVVVDHLDGDLPRLRCGDRTVRVVDGLSSVVVSSYREDRA